jgi:outer membrane protein assembly factor BamC
MTDFRVTQRYVVMMMAGGLLAGCGTTPSPTQIDYRSDVRAKATSLAVPPNLLDETPDQRSLPPKSGQTTLSKLEQVQASAPTSSLDVLPAVPGMHIQRAGTESWLVIDGKAPDQIWPQVRRFWQEQGFLLVIDQRNRGVMETDWNETRPQINDGIIRNTLAKALGDSSYVTSERNKYRTRLEAGPNGGTYVFISQKGLKEALSGPNNDSSEWVPRPNDPGLELEYLKRLMASLAAADTAQGAGEPLSPGGAQTPAAATAALPASGTTAQTVAQNVEFAAEQPSATALAQQQGPSGQYTATEITLGEPYDDTWARVGIALDRANFTVESSDRTRGLYFIRYVDPKDLRSEEQGFWSQLFHGHTPKQAKQYRINVRALTPNQTRVAVVDDAGNIESSRPAREIMNIVTDELQ